MSFDGSAIPGAGVLHAEVTDALARTTIHLNRKSIRRRSTFRPEHGGSDQRQLHSLHHHSHSHSHSNSFRHSNHHGGHHNSEHHIHHHSHHQEDIERFFVVPRDLDLEYGPYVFHGVCDFRLERLQGIQKQLTNMGARVNMLPCTDFVNHVQIWYLDTLIFKCDITELIHGGDGELDPLCIEAARAFDHVSRKAIHGLRYRVDSTNQELVTPYTACMIPGTGEAAVPPLDLPKRMDTADLHLIDSSHPPIQVPPTPGKKSVFVREFLDHDNGEKRVSNPIQKIRKTLNADYLIDPAVPVPPTPGKKSMSVQEFLDHDDGEKRISNPMQKIRKTLNLDHLE